MSCETSRKTRILIFFIMKIIYQFILAVLSMSAIGTISYLTEKNKNLKEEITRLQQAPSVKESHNWEIFIDALAQIESSGDPAKIGEKNSVGLLQIRPVILADANRILGQDKYKDEDRLSAVKSIEIFNVIQNHYNPSHDRQLALKIWNSRASVGYHRKVMAEYERLLSDNF